MAVGQIIDNNGKIIALNRLFKSTPDYTVPNYFSVGTGSATPAVTDTALGTSVPVTSTTVDAMDVTTGWTASADGTVSLNTTTYKSGNASINLFKNGTSTANCNMNKATTSANFTSKQLSVWMYILNSGALAKLATSSCVSIRFGSDSGNYYQWDKNASFFAVGWNYISNLTSANASSTTGTPTITACAYTLIQYTTTSSAITTIAGDIIFDNAIIAGASDFYKLVATGYPVLTESTVNALNRGILLTTDAVGQQLSEYGLFNSDGTPKMFSRMVYTTVNKTQTMQVIYVEKDLIST